MYQTGFFGIPGTSQTTKVHVVETGNRPICGAVVGPKQEFQYCANGIHLNLVECESCRKQILKLNVDVAD
jgi:hypothetical protein